MVVYDLKGHSTEVVKKKKKSIFLLTWINYNVEIRGVLIVTLHDKKKKKNYMQY